MAEGIQGHKDKMAGIIEDKVNDANPNVDGIEVEVDAAKNEGNVQIELAYKTLAASLDNAAVSSLTADAKAQWEAAVAAIDINNSTESAAESTLKSKVDALVSKLETQVMAPHEKSIGAVYNGIDNALVSVRGWTEADTILHPNKTRKVNIKNVRQEFVDMGTKAAFVKVIKSGDEVTLGIATELEFKRGQARQTLVHSIGKINNSSNPDTLAATVAAAVADPSNPAVTAAVVAAITAASPDTTAITTAITAAIIAADSAADPSNSAITAAITAAADNVVADAIADKKILEGLFAHPDFRLDPSGFPLQITNANKEKLSLAIQQARGGGSVAISKGAADKIAELYITSSKNKFITPNGELFKNRKEAMDMKTIEDDLYNKRNASDSFDESLDKARTEKSWLFMIANLLGIDPRGSGPMSELFRYFADLGEEDFMAFTNISEEKVMSDKTIVNGIFKETEKSNLTKESLKTLLGTAKEDESLAETAFTALGVLEGPIGQAAKNMASDVMHRFDGHAWVTEANAEKNSVTFDTSNAKYTVALYKWLAPNIGKGDTFTLFDIDPKSIGQKFSGVPKDQIGEAVKGQMNELGESFKNIGTKPEDPYKEYKKNYPNAVNVSMSGTKITVVALAPAKREEAAAPATP